MKIKLDENLPSDLVAPLVALGHDVDTTCQEGLSRRRDSDVWKAAQREARFLITQDLDFSDIRRFVPGIHHGLFIVRLRTPNRRSLLQRIGILFEQEDVATWKHSFVVATERKVRVHRAGAKP